MNTILLWGASRDECIDIFLWQSSCMNNNDLVISYRNLILSMPLLIIQKLPPVLKPCNKLAWSCHSSHWHWRLRTCPTLLTCRPRWKPIWSWIQTGCNCCGTLVAHFSRVCSRHSWASRARGKPHLWMCLRGGKRVAILRARLKSLGIQKSKKHLLELQVTLSRPTSIHHRFDIICLVVSCQHICNLLTLKSSREFISIDLSRWEILEWMDKDADIWIHFGSNILVAIIHGIWKYLCKTWIRNLKRSYFSSITVGTTNV